MGVCVCVWVIYNKGCVRSLVIRNITVHHENPNQATVSIHGMGRFLGIFFTTQIC